MPMWLLITGLVLVVVCVTILILALCNVSARADIIVQRQFKKFIER